jgi:rhamnosyltransferase
MPNVTIVIPTYQGKSWLADLLPVLRRQEFQGDVEILAVDSGSTDGTVDLLKDFDVTLIEIPNSEFSHGYARNLGVSRARNDVIVFMSQDAMPVDEQWLNDIVHLLDDQRIGAAHVRQLPRSNATPLEEFFHYEMYPPADRHFTWTRGEPMLLDKMFFSNVCSVTYRELCLKHPFPENLIMSEDQIFAKSLLQSGYDTFYSANVKVIHSHHYSLKALFRRNFDSAYSLIGIVDDTLASSAMAGVRFVFREARFLIQRKHWLWLAYLPVYEATRIVSRLLGSYAMRLPTALRVKFSLHRNFWTRPGTEIS